MDGRIASYDSLNSLGLHTKIYGDLKREMPSTRPSERYWATNFYYNVSRRDRRQDHVHHGVKTSGRCERST